MAQRLLSQLAHVEILSPQPQETVDFLTRVLGLQETERRGQSSYLRGWAETFHHSLQVTEANTTGLGHVAWRTDGPEQLDTAVRRLESAGAGEGWNEAGVGHGPAYRYRPLHGRQMMEVFWEVERIKPSGDQLSIFPNRAQRMPAHRIAPRYLDHVTINSPDIRGDCEWYRDTLGHRFMEYTTPPGMELIVFAMMSVCERSHDLGIVPEESQARGRINHVAFWLDQREDLRTAAYFLMENGTPIEFGPGRHGMGDIDYLYFREPGGLRLELNSGTLRNYEPDWRTVAWTADQGSNIFYRNVEFPDSMLESFPPVDEPARAAATPRSVFT